ncbi:2-oxo acid dehydrogenase subunit E2 [candidate division KSB1 bacterium]|nr:2-oxo acid dehydrogenase subunit E2 [candidate division KSB1 bacterium]
MPQGSATVPITSGSISQKGVEIEGHFAAREHLYLTASFDHNYVDGASAASCPWQSNWCCCL